MKDEVKQARRAKRVAEGHQLEIGAQRAPRFLVYHNYHLHLPPEGDLGDTNLWELLEQLNLQDLVAVGGLEAKVGDDYPSIFEGDSRP